MSTASTLSDDVIELDVVAVRLTVNELLQSINDPTFGRVRIRQVLVAVALD